MEEKKTTELPTPVHYTVYLGRLGIIKKLLVLLLHNRHPQRTLTQEVLGTAAALVQGMETANQPGSRARCLNSPSPCLLLLDNSHPTQTTTQQQQRQLQTQACSLTISTPPHKEQGAIQVLTETDAAVNCHLVSHGQPS